jgi:hypothetical protein
MFSSERSGGSKCNVRTGQILCPFLAWLFTGYQISLLNGNFELVLDEPSVLGYVES